MLNSFSHSGSFARIFHVLVSFHRHRRRGCYYFFCSLLTRRWIIYYFRQYRMKRRKHEKWRKKTWNRLNSEIKAATSMQCYAMHRTHDELNAMAKTIKRKIILLLYYYTTSAFRKSRYFRPRCAYITTLQIHLIFKHNARVFSSLTHSLSPCICFAFNVCMHISQLYLSSKNIFEKKCASAFHA